MAYTLEQQIKIARKSVNAEVFGTDAWETAMVVVRKLVDESNALDFSEFCSVDSGLHNYRAADGRIIEMSKDKK